MKSLEKDEIKNLDRRYRANMINCITGFKSANLIGTRSAAGQENLAIFSSVVHLGSDPALLAFIQRPLLDTTSHTYAHIQELGCYTINHVPPHMVTEAHQTSAKYETGISEYDACGFTPYYHRDFGAPAVGESGVRIGLQFVEEIPIKHNGTRMIIGEIAWIEIVEEHILPDGSLALDLSSVAVSGLDTYFRGQRIGQFPYAKAGA
jgi:flavin reductase (DIM6/NTAB) family NADH-FMN oxidoreductase RutF